MNTIFTPAFNTPKPRFASAAPTYCLYVTPTPEVGFFTQAFSKLSGKGSSELAESKPREQAESPEKNCKHSLSFWV